MSIGTGETCVADSSALIALLLDAGPAGRWAAATIGNARLIAPSLVRYECSNVMRRHERAGVISADQATLAHADLLDLTIELWPYELLGPRVWELRGNLPAYDASFVAVAEFVRAPLVTLDRGIGRAPDLGCRVVSP